jgi:hypothetical protein
MLVAPKITIKRPSTTTVSYGTTLVLHAQVDKDLPDGWTIRWTADNNNFKLEQSGDGFSCRATSDLSGDTVITATIYDENNNKMSTAEQELKSDASFFKKIIAFFKRLFGLLETIEQSFR